MTREQREYLKGFGMAGQDITAMRMWFTDRAEGMVLGSLLETVNHADPTHPTQEHQGYIAGVLAAF